MPKTVRGSFDPAVRPLPSVVKGLQACRLPAAMVLATLPPLHRGVSPMQLALQNQSWHSCSSVMRPSSLDLTRSWSLFSAIAPQTDRQDTNGAQELWILDYGAPFANMFSCA